MMQITISAHALAEPNLKPPLTGDMADIVDAFRSNGLIKLVPATFRIGNTLVMHPVQYRELRNVLDETKYRGSFY